MLRIRSLSLLRGMNSFQVVENAKNLSVKKKVAEPVVLLKDATMVAARFVSLFKDEDIKMKCDAMSELRKEPTPDKLEELGKSFKATYSHSNWFKQWIENSIAGKYDDLYSKPFPVDNSEELCAQKAVLASSLYAIKFANSPDLLQKMMDVDSSEIADDVGELIQLYRLTHVNDSLKRYIENKNIDELKKSLATALGVFLDESPRFYGYLNIPVSDSERSANIAMKNNRLSFISILRDNIAFLHVFNNTRVNAEKAAKEAERELAEGVMASNGVIADGKNKGKTQLTKKNDHYCFEQILHCFAYDVSISNAKLDAVAKTLNPLPEVAPHTNMSAFSISLLDDRSSGVDLLDDRSSGLDSTQSLHSNIPQIAIPDEQHLRRVMLTNIKGDGAWGVEPEERIRTALSRMGEVKDVWVFDEEEVDVVDLVSYIVPGTQKTKREQIRERLEKEKSNHAEIERAILASLNATREKKLTKIPSTMRPKHMQKKNKNKVKIMLEDKTTDSYAFVEMATDEGYRNITRSFVKLFGMTIDEQPIGVTPAVQMKRFLVQVGDLQDLKTVMTRINTLLVGICQCHITERDNKPGVTAKLPLFVRLQFDSHSDGWKAFTILYEDYRKGCRNGTANLRPMWRPTEWYREMSHKVKSQRPVIDLLPHEHLSVYKKKALDKAHNAIRARKDMEDAARQREMKKQLNMANKLKKGGNGVDHALIKQKLKESLLAVHQRNFKAGVHDNLEEEEDEEEEEEHNFNEGDDDDDDEIPELTLRKKKGSVEVEVESEEVHEEDFEEEEEEEDDEEHDDDDDEEEDEEEDDETHGVKVEEEKGSTKSRI